MKTPHILYFLTSLILFSCYNNQNTKQGGENSTAIKSKKSHDSIVAAKKKADSILVSTAKQNKIVIIGDKTVTVLDKAKTTKLLKFEFQDTGYSTYWREKRAERDKCFVYLLIKLHSKSKHGDTGGNFFPDLNVFSVNDDNSLSHLGVMDYQLYKKDNLNTAYLEQIFDYKESESFVCWIEVNSPLKKPLIISVNKNKVKTFDGSRVIAKIKIQ